MKKRIGIIITLILMISVTLCFYIYMKTEKLQIVFVDNPRVEYGVYIHPAELIKSHNGVGLQIRELDTSSIGEKQATYIVRKGDKEKEYTLTYEVVDTQAPFIRVTKDKVTANLGDKLNVSSLIS